MWDARTQKIERLNWNIERPWVLTKSSQAAIAELIVGFITRYDIYASRLGQAEVILTIIPWPVKSSRKHRRKSLFGDFVKKSPKFYFLQASFDDFENVPYWYDNTRRLQKMFEDSIRYKLNRAFQIICIFLDFLRKKNITFPQIFGYACILRSLVYSHQFYNMTGCPKKLLTKIWGPCWETQLLGLRWPKGIQSGPKWQKLAQTVQEDPKSSKFYLFLGNVLKILLSPFFGTPPF